MAGLFGFFSSRKSSNTQVYIDDTPETDTGLTGVDKYLKNQKPVANATGVAKYLKTQQQNVPSGVAKYLARQAVASKQKAATELAVIKATGVEKYLKIHESRPVVVQSGVTKYLANRKQTVVSSVTKYLARKIVAERNAPPAVAVLQVTGVAKYLDNRTEVLVTGVSKYMAKKTLSAKQLVAETVAAVESIVVVEPTGVEKYLQAKS